MSEAKKENALDMSVRVDIKNVSPSSATLIRQRVCGTLENFVSANLLKNFVEVVEIDSRGEPADASKI